MSGIKGKFAEGFNDWLIKFIRELCKMYPTNKHFKDAKNKLMILSQSPQYELPIQNFEKYIGPFRQHLREKNEQFFLDFDLKNTKTTFDIESKKMGFNFKNTNMDFLNYIKDLWKVADNNTKETIWKYFSIFDKLSEKYTQV